MKLLFLKIKYSKYPKNRNYTCAHLQSKQPAQPVLSVNSNILFDLRAPSLVSPALMFLGALLMVNELNHAALTTPL